MAKLNYHHLHYFYIIASQGSIAKASKKLHVTPQTLSAQINMFEHQLGFNLFDRTGNRLVLNNMGHAAFQYAEEIFSLGDELMYTLKHPPTKSSMRFSIGVTDVIAKVVSFNFLKAIYTMAEPIKLICKETSLEVLLGELAVNKLDAILTDTALPSSYPLKAHSHLLGKSGMSFFAHHTVANQLALNFPQSLNHQAFFIAGEGTSQRLSVLTWLEQLAITPNIIGELDDSILTKYFAQAGYGAFCAPTIIENHVLEQFKVQLIGRTNDIVERYYLLLPKRKMQHPASNHLLTEGKKLFEHPML